MNTTKLNAFMHITSKTLGENQISLDMTQNSAKIGKVVPSLLVMKKDVNDWKSALSAMVGKSNNSTL